MAIIECPVLSARSWMPIKLSTEGRGVRSCNEAVEKLKKESVPTAFDLIFSVGYFSRHFLIFGLATRHSRQSGQLAHSDACGQ
ncbi:MAG: hypothetical protein WD448_06415, partial [Woeseia sp.]